MALNLHEFLFLSGFYLILLTIGYIIEYRSLKSNNRKLRRENKELRRELEQYHNY